MQNKKNKKTTTIIIIIIINGNINKTKTAINSVYKWNS